MQGTLETLGIGHRVPNFDLSATDGRSYTPQSFAAAEALVLVFLANHCPYVGSWEDRLIAIANDYSSRGVAFAGISSSDVTKFPQDGPDEMKKKAYPFPYLFDESQFAARAFGATRTPEVFLFDKDGMLRYHGAIDSDWEESEETQPYLREALDALLSGSEIPQNETKPVGCSLKLRP